MPFIRSLNVDPDIVRTTHCDINYACLSGECACKVEPFVDRELQLLRCEDERNCAIKTHYLGQPICTCPVNRASFGFN
jgi:hypothetical protein